MKITREEYEQGRVRRRDGQDFRIHAWHDETGTGRILGEVKITDGSWGFQHWNSEGKCRAGKSPLDLILAPRTVYVNLYDGRMARVEASVFNSKNAAEADKIGRQSCRFHRVAVPIELED